MSHKPSAGLLMYRRREGLVEVLLAHPGGPYFRNKDDGSWTIPKGAQEDGEDLLAAGIREFHEETGIQSSPPYRPLSAIRQKGGKVVHAWAFEGDCDADAIASSTLAMEWPPRSGKFATFPEVDRAAFFDLETARRKILPAQIAFLNELEAALQSS